MALVTSKELMLDAQKNHYAIGAFNVENMEMVQAVVAAAEELSSPVIIQTTPGTLKYAPPEMFYANVCAAAKAATVPQNGESRGVASPVLLYMEEILPQLLPLTAFSTFYCILQIIHGGIENTTFL